MDNETGLIIFMTINDYSVYSNYHSQISPPNFLFPGKTHYRTFKTNGIKQKVCLKDVIAIGNIYLEQEMNEAGKRQQKWRDSFFESRNYFKTYTKNSHETVINDIRNILNNQIFWDLDEIWLIDPYLTPKDILETVLFCKKSNVKIKFLTDFSFQMYYISSYTSWYKFVYHPNHEHARVKPNQNNSTFFLYYPSQGLTASQEDGASNKFSNQHLLCYYAKHQPDAHQ